MIIIDSNSLVVLLLGNMNPNLVSKHRRTSIYDKEDYFNLLRVIKSYKNLLVIPNIWTEVDNLLNNFSGNYRYEYVKVISELIKETSEKYLESKIIVSKDYFSSIGLTDSLILELGKNCEFIITSDSKLSDYARANNILVYDMIEEKNKKLKR